MASEDSSQRDFEGVVRALVFLHDQLSGSFATGEVPPVGAVGGDEVEGSANGVVVDGRRKPGPTSVGVPKVPGSLSRDSLRSRPVRRRWAGC